MSATKLISASTQQGAVLTLLFSSTSTTQPLPATAHVAMGITDTRKCIRERSVSKS
jgi:hypothetical protein